MLVSATGCRYGSVKGCAGVTAIALLEALVVPPLFSTATTDAV